MSVNLLVARNLEERFPSFSLELRNFGEDFRATVRKTLEQKHPKVILEVGGVDLSALQKSPDHKYIGLDIDERENCYVVYDRFIHGSIVDKTDLDGVDLAISKAVFEHVPDTTQAFQRLSNVMGSTSVMHHYTPSGFHPYSIALKIVGNKPQKWLIRNLRPRQDPIDTTGYPAFLNHCDPILMHKLLERTGFRDVDFIIYYKATEYFAFFLPVYLLVATFENLASKMGWKVFASGMVITATKLWTQPDRAMTRPPVSIIVCVYNAEKDIPETLGSLLAQSYDALEILVVDDASTDATPVIVREYARRDARVRIVTHPENRGLANGRKTGVAEASHELLTFIDADDVAMPGMIERLVEALLEDDKRLGVSAFRIYFDDTRDLGIQKVGPTSREDYMRLYYGQKLVFLSYPNLVRKTDLLAAGGYRVDVMPNDDGIRYEDFCEDLDMWCRMSDLSADGRYFITLKEPLSRYRKPAGSMSTKNVRIMQDKMRWIKDCLRRRRARMPERSFADFLVSRTAWQRFSDRRADAAAEYYKKAGFAYASRNYPGLVWYLMLTGLTSPKLLRQKAATQRANR